jgi:flagellar basal body rod protein FlgG
VIETQQGPLYTRNGVFHINQNGQIVDSEGRIVAGQLGPVVIPPTIGLSQVHISSDASVSAGGVTIGKFRIVDFGDNTDKLIPAGMNCYLMPEKIEPDAAENVVVKQGYQEASNVKMIDELVNMIVVTRLYEANMKFVSAQREASSSIVSVAMG